MKILLPFFEQTRMRFDNRRGAIAVVRWLKSRNVIPKTLIDAGANNSQWMWRLARAYPEAEVHSFEPQNGCHPIGIWHRVALSDREGVASLAEQGTSLAYLVNGTGVEVRRLDDFSFKAPMFLKVDCERSSLDVLRGGQQTLKQCVGVIVEVWENVFDDLGINQHTEIHKEMEAQGFNRAMTVKVIAWPTSISQTDVLFWRE